MPGRFPGVRAGRTTSMRISLLAVALLAVLAGAVARAEIGHSGHSALAHSARASLAALAPSNNPTRIQDQSRFDLVAAPALTVPGVAAGERVQPEVSTTQSSTLPAERGRDPPAGGAPQ